MHAKAYSPAHITGFFAIFRNGSTGAGINIKDGVVSEVSAKEAAKNKVEIRINGRKAKAATSAKVIEKFLKLAKNKKRNYEINVNHKTKMPIGYGLGISGAGALSLSLALNKALNLKLSKEGCVQIAKEAEIEEGTGLGDVIAEQFHGLMIGKKPYPSTDAEIIPIKEKYVVLAFFKPIETKKVIRNPAMKKRINKTGLGCMKELEKRKSLGNFVKLCNRFSKESGLLTKKLERIIEKVPVASMAMLGETLFIVTNNPSGAKKIMAKYSKRIAVSGIAEEGAKVI